MLLTVSILIMSVITILSCYSVEGKIGIFLMFPAYTGIFSSSGYWLIIFLNTVMEIAPHVVKYYYIFVVTSLFLFAMVVYRAKERKSNNLNYVLCIFIAGTIISFFYREKPSKTETVYVIDNIYFYSERPWAVRIPGRSTVEVYIRYSIFKWKKQIIVKSTRRCSYFIHPYIDPSSGHITMIWKKRFGGIVEDEYILTPDGLKLQN